MFQKMKGTGKNRVANLNKFLSKHIVVGAAFEVVNGMPGMKRDILLHICCLTYQKTKNIRAVFGMCEEHFNWKIHSYFMNVRKTYIHHKFRVNSQSGCIIDYKVDPIECHFATIGCRTLFVDQQVIKGIFLWTVQICYTQQSTKFWFGVASASRVFPLEETLPNLWRGLLKRYDDQALGGRNGSCSFAFQQNFSGALKSWVCGIENRVSSETKHEDPEGIEVAVKTSVRNNSLVTMEVDMDTHVLSYFVDSQKAVVITHIFPELRLGISSERRGSFTSVSLRRLSAAMPSMAPAPAPARACAPVPSLGVEQQRSSYTVFKAMAFDEECEDRQMRWEE